MSAHVLQEAGHLLAGPEPLDSAHVLGELSRGDVLGPLIDELIADAATHPADTLARAACSYHHPLGFEKITLLADDPAYTLRIHIWPPSSTVTVPEHIHNHRFCLASLVLHGSMTMRLFTQDAREQPMTRYAEEPGEVDLGWRLRATGLSAVRRTADLNLATGSQYWLDADMLHQVLPHPVTATVTLFLQTPSAHKRHRRLTTEVYAPPTAVVPEWIPRQPVDTEFYVAALRNARSYISS